MDILTTKINQLRHKRFPMDFKYKIVQQLNGRMLLLIVILILFLLLMFFGTVDISTETTISIQIYQQPVNKSRIGRQEREPIIFSKYKYLNKTYQPSENVIVYLVPSASGNVRLGYNVYPKLRERVLQLDERLGDNLTADVIIFHTGYPFREDLLSIIEGSRRQVEFVNIDHIFYKFSPGFDPHIRSPTWAQKGKWNYHHMCYFWFKQVFELKIMKRYRYMMRLDDDSQIGGKWPNVFDIMAKQQALYLANHKTLDYEYILPGLTLVRNVTAAFIIKNNIIVQNPDMLADIYNRTTDIPNYWNNVEVIDLSLMRRKEVLDFTRVVDESKGIFLYRWGDAPLRYITLALFTNETQVLHIHKMGLGYCHPC